MTVATFNQPNNTTMTGTQYLANVDAGFAVFAGVAGQFAPHQQASANMTVLVDAGSVIYVSNLVSTAQQSTGVITAPTNGTQRIDRVVVSMSTGNVSVITGTQSNSPVAPALATGNFPVAKIALLANSTAIVNSMITDERAYAATNNGTFTSLFVDGLVDISAHSGGQIKFPATANPSSDANTLDDYEEGTFTPTLTFANGATGITYATQVGAYTKIGNVVTAYIYLTLTSKGNSTGNAYINGLPFTTRVSPSTVTVTAGFIWSALNTNWVSVWGWTLGTQLTLFGATAAAAANTTNLVNTDLSNTTNFQSSFTYITTT
jgi:hypothetical protein